MVAKPYTLDYDTPRVPEEDPSVFYPYEDDEPMAEDDRQRRVMIRRQRVSDPILQRPAPDVYVSADIFVYYEMNNPRRSVAPGRFGVLRR